jgi:hypothetical protein
VAVVVAPAWAGIVRGLGIVVGVSEQATRSKEQSKIASSTTLYGRYNLFMETFLLGFVMDDSFVINWYDKQTERKS